MKYDKKRKMREKTGFYEMRVGERETELKCERITRNAGDLAGLMAPNCNALKTSC